MARLNRLNIKITAGLMIFLIALAAATSLLVTRGFNQAEGAALQHSAEGLQMQSQASLIEVTRQEAQLYDADLQNAAHLIEIAAGYMVQAHEAGQPVDWAKSSQRVVWQASQLTRSANGLLYYDANPSRRTEILHPGNITPDAVTDRSLRDSAILDDLFPSLLKQSQTGVGIYYQGPQLTFRYYPVRNLPEMELSNGAAEAAQTMTADSFPVAPKQNPQRQTVWLPPYVDSAGQGLLVSAYTPVYYGNDYQGFIGIDLSLSRLAEQLDALHPTPGSYALLMDGEGRLIATPPDAVERLAGRKLDQQQVSPTGLLGLALKDTNPAFTPVIDAAMKSGPGAGQVSLAGQPMLVTYAALPNLGWRLLVVIPVSELTTGSKAVAQSIHKDGLITVRNTLVLMGVFFLVAMLISILLGNRFISRPVLQMLRGVRGITAGDLTVTVPVTSQDELGELAASFNQMTSQLKRRTQELSQTSAALQLTEAQVKVAALEERQRLARELHDSVSQALYGIALGAKTARTQLDRDPGKVAEPLDYVLSLADAGLSEMRALIFELRPESLQNEGLVAALTKQADALRARYRVEVVTEFDHEPEISIEQKEALYRIGQEALHNIAKHAKATLVKLSLNRKDGVTILEVRDNGKGFNPQAEFPGHLGLHSMRERVEPFGGRLAIESQPGTGTIITARLPGEGSRLSPP
jgi:signal transduction histidine kinase